MIQFRHIILDARAEALLGALIAARAEGDRRPLLVDEAIGAAGLQFRPALAGEHQPSALMALRRESLINLAAAGPQEWRVAVTRTGQEYYADACDFPPATAPPPRAAAEGLDDPVP